MKRLSPVRASQSYSEMEVTVLGEVLNGMLAGRDVSLLMRRPEFASLVSKTAAMKRRLAALKADRENGGQRAEQEKAS